jgi:hypothetical protein
LGSNLERFLAITYFRETLESLLHEGFLGFSLKFVETFKLESSMMMLSFGEKTCVIRFAKYGKKSLKGFTHNSANFVLHIHVITRREKKYKSSSRCCTYYGKKKMIFGAANNSAPLQFHIKTVIFSK